jgi:aminoglycoside phosphotransferase (APT) family kinase protein
MRAPIDPASTGNVREALAAYLAARGDLAGAQIGEGPEPLGSGFDSFIYTFRLSGAPAGLWGEPIVLRLQADTSAVAKVQREAALLTFLSGIGYPVPLVLAAEDAGNPFGLPFMIMERIRGGTMLARVMSNPLRAGGLLARLAAVHVDLHRLPTDGWPLDEGSGPLAVRQIADFRQRIDERSIDQLREGVDWLDRHVSCVLPEVRVMTHNDFHPLNVLVTDDGALSVIDWPDAALGDRHHDVARTLTIFSFAYIAASSNVERLLLKAARGFLRSRYFKPYNAGFPVDPRRLAYFEALQSFNGLLQVSEVAYLEQEGRARTAAARGLPPELLEEVRRFVSKRMADAERVLTQ